MAAPRLTFLSDGGQSPAEVAGLVAEFFAAAGRSLDIAIYDLHLQGPSREVLVGAVEAARARGVRFRLAFNVDRRRPSVPSPPISDWTLVRQLGVPLRPVLGQGALMHDKYVIRDAGTPAAAVLTGSTNWTDDSWSREENVLVTVESEALASSYLADFEPMWSTGTVAAAAAYDPAWIDLGEGVAVRPHFCPGGAPELVHGIALALARARRRVRVCSPVITSGPILAALGEMLHRRGLDLRGVFDLTQMREVSAEWADQRHQSWKLMAFESVISGGRFSAKRSQPYRPGAVHDYMHAKIVVADDTAFVGSFNHSHSGEDNAENVLEFRGAELAGRLAGFVDAVAARYPVTASLESEPL